MNEAFLTMRASAEGTLIDTLGIDLLEAAPGRVRASMPVTRKVHQPFGVLHGGASIALAETVASIGGNLNVDPTSHMAVGLEINANHLRSKQDGTVTATAEPIHLGRTTQVWDVRIVDEDEKLVCASRCTLAVVARGR